jgi:phage-related protein
MEKIVTKQPLSRAAAFNIMMEMVITTIAIVISIGPLLTKESKLAFWGLLICIFFGILCFIFVGIEDYWEK